MRKVIYFLFFQAIAIAAFGKSNKLTIQGQYLNFTKDSIWIKNQYYDKVAVLVLDSQGRFNQTLQLPMAYYKFSDGKNYFMAFLRPGDQLTLHIDVNRFDSSLVFEGKGSKENNYLKEKQLLEIALSPIDYYGYFAALPEPAFLRLSDSVYQLKCHLLAQHRKGLSTDFFDIESMGLLSEYKRKLYNYPGMHRFVSSDKSFKVSEQYPDAFAGIDLQTIDYQLSADYRNYVQSYLEHMAALDLRNKKDSNYYVAYLKHVSSDLKSYALREYCAYEIGRYRLSKAKAIDTLYVQIMQHLYNPLRIEEVKQTYLQLKKLNKGAVAPLFSFEDQKGQRHELVQFRGQLLYIDVWSTWCLPCLKEIPYLKALEDSLAHSQCRIISICKSSNRADWEKLLKREDLKGMQLFATSSEDAFFKAFAINGVPHYIIIDQAGNILDADAKRPSDPALLNELRSYLKQP